ncbi:hypothetical protein [Anaeroselena agilis]|uniref:Uncharacterized protein n=1 Tax=Anaeroselena agilis TaxID=3063788 RepID=A0ABU3NYB8_9FIRM|nr:hypothetical protein [Selenomonadales bacterium 4137-cl]
MFTTHKIAIVSNKKPQEALSIIQKHITSDKSTPKFFVGKVDGSSFYINRRDEPIFRDMYIVRVSGTISEHGEGSLIDISMRPRIFYLIAFLVLFMFITIIPGIFGKVVPQFLIIFAIAIAISTYGYLTEVKLVTQYLKKIFA